MPRSSAAETASGMLNGLKSRLGFAQNDDDGYDGNDFDEYDDFDDDNGFSAKNDREYAGYGADYDENAPVGGFKPATTRSGRFGRADSTPELVSIDDVKTRTRSTTGRNLIDERAPAASSPAYNASLRDRERQASKRSEGYNSLFEPTSGRAGSASSASGAGASRDPGASSLGYAAASHGASRGLTVVKPLTYTDAERVTHALKAGDVAVLAMRNTSPDLFKRILDFSFGAASALDASVECPAERVFAIARGAALSEEEIRRLQNQGVI